jgi:hypothetical protein
MSIIPVLRRQKQEDDKFKTSLDYIMRLCLKKENPNTDLSILFHGRCIKSWDLKKLKQLLRFLLSSPVLSRIHSVFEHICALCDRRP